MMDARGLAGGLFKRVMGAEPPRQLGYNPDAWGVHPADVDHSLWEINPGKLDFYFHEGQQRAWDSEARFTFVTAGSQGGKTSFGPLWLLREINRRGAGDYLAVSATFDLFKLKMLPEIRNLFEHTLGIGRYWSGDKVIELMDPEGQFWAERADDPMWGRIILRSASAGGGLESATAQAAWLDECGLDDFTLGTWEAVQARLTLHQGRVLGTTTPYNLGWLKQQIVDKAHTSDDIEVIAFDSTLNPSFPKDEFKRLQKSMPLWKFNMRYRGRFERPAGMIYADFVDKYKNDGGHKVQPFELPSTWARYVGVDPGAVNTAMIWLAHDPKENVYYLYRESLEGGKSTPEHAQGAARLAKDKGERVIRYYVGQKSETQQRLDWQQAGVRNVAAPTVHDVESGIDRVVQLLREHRLYVFDDCLGVLDEIGRYARKLDKNGEPTEQIKDKATYHRLDAVRYAAVGVTSPKGVFVG